MYRKVLGVYDRNSASDMLFATNTILKFEALIRKSNFAFIMFTTIQLYKRIACQILAILLFVQFRDLVL